MKDDQRYCPQCENRILPYLGQEDVYHCLICDRSYDREEVKKKSWLERRLMKFTQLEKETGSCEE